MRFNLGGSRKAIEATCNCACEPRWEDADGLEDLTNEGFQTAARRPAQHSRTRT